MMTPEEARRLLDSDSRSTHGPGTAYHACKAIRQHARQMAHQIADMHYEYVVLADGMMLYLDHQTKRGTIRQHWGTYGEALNLAERFSSWKSQILRRLVSNPEENTNA